LGTRSLVATDQPNIKQSSVGEELIDGVDDPNILDDRPLLYLQSESPERLSHACCPPMNV